MIGFLIVLLDLLLFFRAKSKGVLLFAFISLFFNVSVVYYYLILNLPNPIELSHGHIPGELYSILFTGLLIFSLLKYFLLKGIEVDFVPSYRNDFFALVSVVAITLSLVLGINDSPDLTGPYEPRITPLFEYSILFFVIGLLSVRKKSALWWVLFIQFILLVWIDSTNGGRITSIQVASVFLLLSFHTYLTRWKLIVITPLGVLFASYVSLTRHGLSLNGIVDEAIKNLAQFDTAVFSFYASATQLGYSQSLGPWERIESLLFFLSNIVLGGNAGSNGDVTYLGSLYKYNVGGGMFFSWFMFWGGVFSLIFGVYLVFRLFQKLSFRRTVYTDTILVFIFASSPRWYLYGPMYLFRSAFFIAVILIFLLLQFTNYFRATS